MGYHVEGMNPDVKANIMRRLKTKIYNGQKLTEDEEDLYTILKTKKRYYQ